MTVYMSNIILPLVSTVYDVVFPRWFEENDVSFIVHTSPRRPSFNVMCFCFALLTMYGKSNRRML